MKEANGKLIIESREDCYSAEKVLDSYLNCPFPETEDISKECLRSFFCQLAKYDDFPFETDNNSSYLPVIVLILGRVTIYCQKGQYTNALDEMNELRIPYLVTSVKAMLLETGRKVFDNDFSKQ